MSPLRCHTNGLDSRPPTAALLRVSDIPKSGMNYRVYPFMYCL